jgi:hypothetical protein
MQEGGPSGLFFSAASGAMAAAEDGALYWGSLEREVRGLMEGATAAEAVLSSDEEGAADELLEGVTLGWSRSRRMAIQAEYVEAPRSESKVAAASAAFHNRFAAAFDSLPSPAAIAAVGPAEPGVFGRVGPAFSRQCEGHSLAEPESDGSWQSILAQEVRIRQEEQQQASSSAPDHVDDASLAEMARKAAIEADTGDAAESSGEEGEEDWDQGWEDSDGLRGGGSEDEDVEGVDRRTGDARPSRRPAGRSAGVTAHDVAEWSMHTASWARDGSDSDDDEAVGGEGASFATARDAARRMAAAASAEGLAPSGGAVGSGASFCAPAFGGLDDLDDLGSVGDGGGWGAEAPPDVSMDAPMDVSAGASVDVSRTSMDMSMDVFADVSTGASVGADAGSYTADAAPESAGYRLPTAHAHAPTDAPKRGAPPSCTVATGSASDASTGGVGAGRPPHASAKRVRFDEEGPTGTELRSPVGLGGSDPFIRDLLNAGRPSGIPTGRGAAGASVQARGSTAASGAHAQGTPVQPPHGAAAALSALVPAAVAGLGAGRSYEGGLGGILSEADETQGATTLGGVPQAGATGGQRRATGGASCAGRARSGGQRAGYTLYTLEDVTDSSDTNMAALTQARAILAGASRLEVSSADGAQGDGGGGEMNPAAEVGREATFGRRPARPAPPASGGARGGRAGADVAPAVRLDHLETEEEAIMGGAEEAHGAGGDGMPQSGSSHLGRGNGVTATSRRFRRPAAELADADMGEIG